MPATDFNTAFGPGPKPAPFIIQTLEKRGAYVVLDNESVTSLTPGQVTYLIFNGIMFKFDATDTTTAHDGVTCCVTSDGKRFKSFNYNGAQARIKPVLSRTLTAPPGSPALGASYIVAAGGTGAWAGKDKLFAEWTTRGWMFISPNTYDMALVVAENLFYHYNAAGNWVSGIPALTIGANSVPPSALRYGRFGLTVINQTTTAPPPTPTDGDAYVIAPSATGAWSGQSGKLAVYEGSAFTLYTPYKGATVYDAGTNSAIVHDGTSWVSATSGYSQRKQDLGSVASRTLFAGYVYSPGTPPTLSQSISTVTDFSHVAKKAGAWIEIEASIAFTGDTTASTTADVTLCLFFDNVANASDWRPLFQYGANISKSENATALFLIQAPDIAPHDYKIRLAGARGGAGTASVAINRYRTILREAT